MLVAQWWRQEHVIIYKRDAFMENTAQVLQIPVQELVITAVLNVTELHLLIVLNVLLSLLMENPVRPQEVVEIVN
jgi:hypothetical protein